MTPDLVIDNTPSPRFPPELEREIFVYAVQISTQEPTILFLVAKRVHEWLLPEVCRVLRSLPPFLRTLPQFEKYGPYVEHLAILAQHIFHHGDPTDIRPIMGDCISKCSNLTNLLLPTYIHPRYLEFLVCLPKLTHLGTYSESVLNMIQGLVSSVDTVQGPVFPKVTHFQTFSTPREFTTSTENMSALAYHFPGLTHIGFGPLSPTSVGHTWIPGFTAKFPNIKAIVLWDMGGPLTEKKVAGLGRDDDLDERIVTLGTAWLQDWEGEARGTGLGVWGFAEKVLVERKAKCLPPIASFS